MDESQSAVKLLRKEAVVVRQWQAEPETELYHLENDRVEDIEILTEAEFSEKFNTSRSSTYFKRMRYVQTCVKARTGVGLPIIIQFYAPLPVQQPGDKTSRIKYDFKAAGDDIQMIKNQDDYGYCTKQVLKFCFYV